MTDPWLLDASALVATVATTPDEDFRSPKKAFARPVPIDKA
jgi:hypothetical protein